jgi:hypothetical protein
LTDPFLLLFGIFVGIYYTALTLILQWLLRDKPKEKIEGNPID